jgi:SAM-dependent methyltransferase
VVAWRSMSAPSPPVPPVELAARVGPGPGADPIEAYEREGAAVRGRIERLLPDGWTYDGKRVLDFGCGAARVLRHFLAEAQRGEFWGCDIDAASIDWIAANLSPPLRCFRNELAPPLALDSDSLDLVYATSVFTHIDERWSDWLVELHRVLTPGGVLIATFLAEGMWEALIGEPYREDEVGMTVRRHWTGPDAWVFHSEWWLREHWGRAFDVDRVSRPPQTDEGSPQITHSYIALHKRAGAVTSEHLQCCDPGEPRELAALQTNVRLLRQEMDGLIAERARPDLPLALRQAVLASPLAGPARTLRRGVRGVRAWRRGLSS